MLTDYFSGNMLRTKSKNFIQEEAMYQLVYASTASDLVKLEVVEDIVAKSKANNERDNVTGFLVFNSGYFLQCLEGDISAVNKTFCNIAADKRHFDTIILSYNEVSERSFPNWTMALATEVKSKKELYFKYGYVNEFNPYKMAPKGALPFLKELAAMYY